MLKTIQSIKQKTAPILRIISSSFQFNPVWEYKISQLYYMMAQQRKQVIRSIGEISQYNSRTSNQISDMLYDSYKKQDALFDRMHDNFSDAIKGVDTYRDPVNNLQVKVPNIYEKAWSDGNDYIFTSDPSFNPNQNSEPNWTPLERRP